MTAAQFTDAIYVNAASTAPGGGDGEDWSTAYASLQNGLDAAAANPGIPIWVAQGIYHPSKVAAGADIPKNYTFKLLNNVKVYGGFVGNESDLKQRNPELYETILDGEVVIPPVPTCDNPAPGAGNCFMPTSVPTCTNSLCCSMVCDFDSDCCDVAWDQECVDLAVELQCSGGVAGGTTIRVNSVVTAANLGPATTLNGFTIRNGQATDSGVGAGILASDCQATFVRCRIQDNEAQSGAGMYVSGVPSPIVVDCRFRNNVAVQFGGGVYNNRSDIALINTLIDNNTAGNQGGGFFNESPALVGVVNMINCTITDNVAANWAGIGLSGTGTVLINCIVWGTPGICCSDSRHVG